MSTESKPAHLWRPGESANPGGRPGWLKEFRDLARENVPAALAKLMQFVDGKVINGGVEEKVPLRLQFQAVQELLDRTMGKAVQNTNLGIGFEPHEPQGETEKLISDIELAQQVAFMLDAGMRARTKLTELAAVSTGEPHEQ